MEVIVVAFLMVFLAAWLAVAFLRWVASAKPRVKLAFATATFAALPMFSLTYKVPAVALTTVLIARGWGGERPRVARFGHRSRAWA